MIKEKVINKIKNKIKTIAPWREWKLQSRADLIKYAKKNNIPITTFMIASDPYLQTFVKKFSEVNNGKAFYTGLDGLSEMVFEDYDKNRRQKLR